MTTRPEPLVSWHESWGRVSATEFRPSRTGFFGQRGPQAYGALMRAEASPSHDNYEAFIARLDAATSNLRVRAAALDKAMAAVSLLWGPYESAVRNWERRRLHVSGQLARHSGSPPSDSLPPYSALSELHDVAVNMEALFRDRAQRITEKLELMQGRRGDIDKALLELELSTVKLNSSRRLSQDRENLRAVFSSLAGAAVATSTLPGQGLLSDLKEARKAVTLAEALMEVKGH